MMKTLAELNNKSHQFEQHGLTLQFEWAVGRVGHRNSGSKTHLLYVERIVAVNVPDGRCKVGQAFSAGAPCNGNGQNIGRVTAGLDTDKVTCTSCLSRLTK